MKKKISIIIIFILGLILVGLSYFNHNFLKEDHVDLPKEKTSNETLGTEAKTNTKKQYVEREKNNPNNYIKIDSILYNRVMDDDGTNYYLNHNLDGIEDDIGIPYIDFRTDFKTRKSLIYAHSTPNGKGPFQVLQNYHNNYNFYLEHPLIEVRYNDITYQFQIFSVYISTANSEEDPGLEYFYHLYYSDEKWDNKIKEYKSLSEYDTGVEVSKEDKVLILQTCSMDPNYYEKYYRYNLLVFGKMISQEKNSN